MAFHPDHFYVTLPSNSSEPYYGRQEAGNYQTRLAIPLRVDPEDYEVGLVGVTLPRTLFNVPALDLLYTYLAREGAHYTIHIPAGHYKSIPHLLRTIKKKTKDVIDIEAGPDHAFSYSKVTGRVTCTVAEGFRVSFTDTLAILLGFGNAKKIMLGGTTDTVISPDLSYFKGSEIEGEFEANVNRLTETLMVYSDIVTPQYVGDHLVPLLRHITHLNTGEGDLTEESFIHVHYVALQRANIDSITIFYADATGKSPTFTSGSSIAKLHFRRKA